MNYSRDYVQGHETQYLDQIAVILVSKGQAENGLARLDGLLKLGRKIETEVLKLRVVSKEHGPITFFDICAKSRSSGGQNCQTNDILRLDAEVGKVLIALNQFNETFLSGSEGSARRQHELNVSHFQGSF